MFRHVGNSSEENSADNSDYVVGDSGLWYFGLTVGSEKRKQALTIVTWSTENSLRKFAADWVAVCSSVMGEESSWKLLSDTIFEFGIKLQSQ